MIKAGQIYKQKDNDTFVIVYINGYKLVYTLYRNGDEVCYNQNDLEEFIEKNCELVAEYPNWRDAASSKEFKND